MHTPKGLASFPHLLTEEDVLRFNAGISPLSAEEAPSVPAEETSIVPEPIAEPEPVAEIPPPPPAPTEPPADVPTDPPPADVEPPVLSDEEMIEKLEKENTKAELVAMAEAAGLDQTGNKPELAARLVAHYRAQ